MPPGDYTVHILDSSGADLYDCSGHVNNPVPTAVADTTAPVTTLYASGTPGANGWYTSNVGVTLIAADNYGGSEVKSITYHVDTGADQTVAGDLATVTLTSGTHVIKYWSTDNALNTEAAKSMAINVDTTTPSVTWSANASPNSNGWYVHDVLIHFTPHVGISDVQSITPDQVITSSGQATGTVTDNAGRTASVTTDRISIDNASPSTTVSAPTGNNGWYIGPLTLNARAVQRFIHGRMGWKR